MVDQEETDFEKALRLSKDDKGLACSAYISDSLECSKDSTHVRRIRKAFKGFGRRSEDLEDDQRTRKMFKGYLHVVVLVVSHACATDGNAKRPTSGYQRNGPWFRARCDGRTRVEAVYKIDAVYLTIPDSVSVGHVLVWFGAGVRFGRGYFLFVCVL